MSIWTMLNIMLCGASDMAEVAAGFAEVTSDIGGEMWHYLSGGISYLNHSTASWEANSRRTVAGADICVFVILQHYGEITWTTELREALDSGKPFLLLCLESTRDEYFALTRNVPTSAIEDPDKRLLVETIAELESERHLTIATFNPNTFKDVYRREVSKLFRHALQALALRLQRESLARLLGTPEKLSNRELADAEDLAVDEFEDKTRRKLAIEALVARHAASPETVLALLHSREQGVQRFTVAQLADLYTQRPADSEFLNDCVVMANASDDTGVVRRLIPALLAIDVAKAVQALEGLDLSEIGTRRRLAAALEERELEVLAAGLGNETAALLSRCLSKSEEAGWLARCREYLHRLSPE